MSNYTILIIDYEPRTLEIFRVPLEAAGYRVETAANGVEGIRAFKKFEPAVTFIEFMLPKKSGLEVCKEIRETDLGAKAPIVIMSSRFRSRQYRMEALLKYKADDFVEKPLDQETIFNIVQTFLKNHPEPTVAPRAEPSSTASVAAPAASAAPVTDPTPAVAPPAPVAAQPAKAAPVTAPAAAAAAVKTAEPDSPPASTVSPAAGPDADEVVDFNFDGIDKPPIDQKNNEPVDEVETEISDHLDAVLGDL